MLVCSLVLASCAVTGAAAGWVWEWVWSPPTGTVTGGSWALDGLAVAGEFSGTGLFVLLGGAAGLLLGLLATRLAGHAEPDVEPAVLAVLAVGAVLATSLMWQVGPAGGPPDPAAVVASAPQSAWEGRHLPADLRVRGTGAFLALPAGALLGAAAGFLLAGRRPDRPR